MLRNKIYHDIFTCNYKKRNSTYWIRIDGIYLYMEILEFYCDNQKLKKIHKFSLEQLFKKSMKEIYYYGVWIGMIILNKNMEMEI